VNKILDNKLKKEIIKVENKLNWKQMEMLKKIFPA
jgi:hypothetical protein